VPDEAVVLDVPGKLHGAKAATLEAWVFLRRVGEQTFAGRGLPSIGAGGERFFRRTEGWTNYFIGTDHRGFLMGCINGNSRMPFPLVTLEMLKPGEWHQIVVVKQADGFQRFHHDGALVHSDHSAEVGGQSWSFVDEQPGEPLRISAPLGGAIGEVSLWARELDEEEIRTAWESHKSRYVPHGSANPVTMLPMHEHPAAHPLAETAEAWKGKRDHILAEWKRLLGPDPNAIPSLEPEEHGETDCGSYIRRKISIQVQIGDRMPCWLLVPKQVAASQRMPAVICFYGTTGGAGKDTTVGLSGAKPGTPPLKNRASRSTWSRRASSRSRPIFCATANAFHRAVVRTIPRTSTNDSPSGLAWERIAGTYDARLIISSRYPSSRQIGSAWSAIVTAVTPRFSRWAWKRVYEQASQADRSRILCCTVITGPCRRGQVRANRCHRCGRISSNIGHHRSVSPKSPRSLHLAHCG
jgi:hypothetical protein